MRCRPNLCSKRCKSASAEILPPTTSQCDHHPWGNGKSKFATVGGVRGTTDGYTLVEVMLGAAIMLVLFTTLYAAMIFAVSVIRVARENLRATQIIVNRMEGIRLFRWDQLTDTSLLPTTFTELYNPLGTNGDQGVTYTGTVTVAAATLSPPASYSTNMYLITVQLQWESEGVLRTRQMSTYSALNGIQNYVYSNPD